MLEQGSLRFHGREPAVDAIVQLDADLLAEKPPQRVRGRITEVGGLPVLGDFRIESGCHTISFGTNGPTYRLEMLQADANWFEAELVPSGNRPSSMSRSLTTGIGISFCGFAAVNCLHLMRRVTCADCRFPYGLPFTLFQSGGFAGDAGFLWIGFVADLMTIVASGAALAWIIAGLSKNR